ncbi:MAG: DNA helicase RecQ [Gemmataceae bacterium]
MSADPLLDTISTHWGFRSLRPLQRPAMDAFLAGRDCLVVLPTGGGKSLCFQAPAVAMGGTTVVVSPLIALMKDQVDGLRSIGVPACQLDSSQTPAERRANEADLVAGKVRLLYVSPEKLIGSDLPRLLERIGVKRFAIDEAHCISHWGHDFRPEYRQMARLRELVPGASVHAFTATATEKVRADICVQLGLQDPEVMVGGFDRPNLTYRVWPRHNVERQVLEVLARHKDEAGIIYTMRRKDVDDLAGRLKERGIRAMPYHAGMATADRQATQEAFAKDECDVVVATIAFGMGIDRSNVRFVLHASLPKSLEHFQQETGRAGRDGLEAECVLLYSGADVMSMRRMIEKSAEEAMDRSFLPGVLRHLEDMDRFARGAVCRHKQLVNYFGQEFPKDNCGACDLCLGDFEEVPDAGTVAKKILSCVARVKENFGVGHVLKVLRGKADEGVRKWGHDKLTTFGLLADAPENDLRDWIYQIIGHGALWQTEDEFPKLRLTDVSWEVMKGQRDVRLVRLARRGKGERPKRAALDAAAMEGVDGALLTELRALRKKLADERQVPAFVIFNDLTMRELARLRPTTPAGLRQVTGIGEAKARDLGAVLLQVLGRHGAEADYESAPMSDRKREIFPLFADGMTVEQVMEKSKLARSTTANYLAEYIAYARPESLEPWGIDAALVRRVMQAAREAGGTQLRPIFLKLGEQVSYDVIKCVLALGREAEG